MAGVALGDSYRHFAWQAWPLRHWAGCCGALGPDLALCRRGCFAWQAWHLVTSTLVSCGRRGTWRHLSSLCVVGVALTALGWLRWRAWSRSGALSPRLFCVAGVAFGDIHPRFTWQAWHLATSIVTLRGRCGTHGTVSLVVRDGLELRRQLTTWHVNCRCIDQTSLSC